MAGRRDAGARRVMSAFTSRVMPDNLALLRVLEATIETLKAENEITEAPARRRRDAGGASGDHRNGSMRWRPSAPGPGGGCWRANPAAPAP